MLYKTEFPTYDDTLPNLAGFVDDSWRHDVCPSMHNQVLGVKLWIDWQDYDQRECGGKRYTLCKEGDDCMYIALFESDSLAEVITFIEGLA